MTLDNDEAAQNADLYADFNKAVYGDRVAQGDDTIAPPSEADDSPAIPGEEGKVDEQDESRFGAELDQLARSYGFTDEELDSIETEDELRRAMRIMDRQMAESMRSTEPAEPEETQAQQQAQPATPMSTPEELAVVLDMLDEDDPIRKSFTAIIEDRNSLRSEIAEIRNTILSQQQAQQQQYSQQVIGWFDQQLDEMSSELYGAGKTRSPVQQKNRAEVYDMFRRLVETDLQSGREPNWELYLTRSRNGVHGLTGKLPESKKRADVIRERSMRRSAAGRSKGVPRTAQMGAVNNLSEDPDLMDQVNRIANTEYAWG